SPPATGRPGPSETLFSYLPLQPKQPQAIVPGVRRHLLRGDALPLRQFFHNVGEIPAVVPPAPVGHRAHVGRVRLHHDPVQGRDGHDLRRPASVFVGHRTVKAQIPAPLQQLLRHFGTAGEAVEYAPHPGELLYDLQAVSVGLPVVDDHRQLQLQRQLQLAAEHHLLEFLWRILRPVVVQADLSDGDHFFLPAQVPDGGKIRGRAAGAVLRMDACGGEQPGAALRQGQGGAGAL
ncbi:Stage 0 sporulation A-like protein, partial [Dysosmobacter welbionis]